MHLNSSAAEEVIDDSPAARMCRFASLPAAFLVVLLIPPLVTHDYDRLFKHLGIFGAIMFAYVLACYCFGKSHDNPQYLAHNKESKRYQSVFKKAQPPVSIVSTVSTAASTGVHYQSLAELGPDPQAPSLSP